MLHNTIFWSYPVFEGSQNKNLYARHKVIFNNCYVHNCFIKLFGKQDLISNKKKEYRSSNIMQYNPP